MRLHSPAFEKRLRQDVRGAVKASPQLKREFRNANRRRKHYSLGILGRPALCLLLAMAVWWLCLEQQPVPTGLAAIALWTFGLLFFQVNSLLSLLFAAPDLPALSVLPIEGTTVFRWQLEKFIRRSGWVLVDVFVACSVVARVQEFTVVQWLLILPVAVLAWLLSVGSALLLASRWPRFPYALVSFALGLLLVAAVILRSFVGPLLLELFNRCTPWMLLVLPTGWPVSLLEALLDSKHALNFSLLIPIGLVLVTLKSSLARLRHHYDFAETTLPEPPDLLPGVEPEPPPSETAEAFPRRVGPTEIEEIIRSCQFLAAPPWPQRGWLERLLWRWLNERERNLMEMAFAGGPMLTRPWLKTFRTLLIGAIVALVAMQFVPALTAWVLGGILFLTTCKVLWLFLGTGLAFQPVTCGGVNIPFHAGFPVGFRELTRLLAKYSAVQLPALMLFTGAGGALVGSILAKSSWTMGLVIGIKVAILLFALRFVAAVLSISSVTNDTAHFRMRTITLVVVMVGGALTFLVLAGVGLAVPHAGVAWSSVLLACLVCFGTFRSYAWFYDANFFDLMNLPRK